MLLNLVQSLGGSILDVDEATVLQMLDRADLVLLGDDPCLACSCYPFHKRMEQLLPRMRAVCERDMVALRQEFIQNMPLTLYVRPRLAVAGGMENWVTDRGITLTRSAAALRKMPAVRLQGHFHPHMLGYRLPHGTVSFATRSGPKELSVTMEAEGEKYSICFRVDPRDFEGDGDVTLSSRFDSAFTWRDVGLNEDIRKRVVYVPECTLEHVP